MPHVLTSWEAHGDHTALKYNLYLSGVVSIHIFPHLPRLVAWERRKTEGKQTYIHCANLYIDL